MKREEDTPPDASRCGSAFTSYADHQTIRTPTGDSALRSVRRQWVNAATMFVFLCPSDVRSVPVHNVLLSFTLVRNGRFELFLFCFVFCCSCFAFAVSFLRSVPCFFL
ncbi:hypothetical protein NL108_017314 [Boleophthalmus pectinirostris]|nr:hypothetical protein NL108_017314 [Boleophthalmus pectinirostris]